MCGIAAARGADEVYLLLESLQHRGQESAGIAWVEGDEIKFVGGLGLVKEAIKEVTDKGPAIGHVRYSTSGGYSRIQPVHNKHYALAFNGNIVNFYELWNTDWDAEALLMAIINEITKGKDVVSSVKEVLRRVRGSYSLLMLTSKGQVIVARDPKGFRPLAFEGAYVASETAALEDLGKGWKEVEANELLLIEEGEIVRKERISEYDGKRAYCAFEYVYFERPESYFNGINVHESRKRMGMILAKEKPADADVVIPVPDSGRSAAIGFSRASGIPLDEALVKNRYVGRSFIMPPGMREKIAIKKYGVVKEVVEGKRVVVVDDSIIRGTTMKRIVKLLRDKGAKEVHVRSASPKVRAPCYMGIDFPDPKELIASMKTEEELAELWGADSVGYLSVEGLVKAIGTEELCLACFTGKYPIRITEEDKVRHLRAHRS
ncbi:amidophosphoribosyltransferase [Ignicoccus pacificus DSM 13166]|uniref:Amidophosphoribosyltransferase n=1 Tax=Ignicoccus pacificus DSM 13166 TaxID=940294 RepID=A0A977K9N7_9CREN|nr:amidophosphoribosyltransferase [Ignicoccus pacificus DSM 13166]